MSTKDMLGLSFFKLYFQKVIRMNIILITLKTQGASFMKDEDRMSFLSSKWHWHNRVKTHWHVCVSNLIPQLLKEGID
jgi:hypothetical protein